LGAKGSTCFAETDAEKLERITRESGRRAVARAEQGRKPKELALNFKYKVGVSFSPIHVGMNSAIPLNSISVLGQQA
jgi:hypothetical protein